MKTFLIKVGFLSFLLISFIIILGQFYFALAQKNDQKMKRASSQPLAVRPDSTMINIGNIAMWIYADGRSAIEPQWDAGAIYPRGTARVIYTDGIVWGGIVKDGFEPSIRVGGQTYNSGTQPGTMITKGVAENPDAPNVNRVWRIARRDYRYDSYSLQQDVAEFYRKPVTQVTDAEIQAVLARYDKDWNEWPWQKGAPFYDINGDGVYDPTIDEPGLANADQVVWFVANDLESAATKSLYGSPPIGIEMQVTLWSYRRSDALGNVIFKRYRLTYKGTAATPSMAKIDSMYIAQWSDPDLGDFADDFVGCDTTLSLGYVYNSNSFDAEFQKFGLVPPAVGYDFFQGPMVLTGKPTDQAIFNFKKFPGAVNLPMTSFWNKGSGSAISDPPFGVYQGTLQWWNLIRGYLPHSDYLHPTPWIDPNGNPTRFMTPGDPATGTGWIDGIQLTAGDRRLSLSSGPFPLALGETQELVIGLVAGLGGDRLLSVSVMKYNDRVAQAAFNNLLDLPKPPPSPKLTATELDGKILLNWGENQKNVEAIEQLDDHGYKFEGYNVYQLPHANAWLGNGVKLATFDLVNEVTTILQEEFDPQSGAIIQKPVQIGKNSGIVRTLLIRNDAFRNAPLVNGRQYFFAVTAYNHNPDRQMVTKSLESTPAIVSVTPHSLSPGITLGAAIEDTLPVTHNQGKSTGKVIARVVDPTKLTGDEYKVSFGVHAKGDTVWNLLNVTKGTTIFSEMTNMSGDKDYLIADGVQVIVTKPSRGVKPLDIFDNNDRSTWGWDVPSGSRKWTWENANGLNLEGFRGAIGAGYFFSGTSVKELKNVLIKFATTDQEGKFDPIDPDVSYGYRYLRRATMPPAQPEFEPFILNRLPGHAFQIFEKNVPLAVFDVEDAARPRRLAVGFLENNIAGGMVNGRYWPPNFQGANNTDSSGPREWLFIVDVNYSETPNPSLAVDILNTTLPVMYTITAARFGNVAFETGDEFAIYPNQPFTVNDEFVFRTIAPIFDPAKAREDVRRQVNVFPNPFYGLFLEDASSANRYVTFSHLPKKAVIRIFTLAGTLVKTIIKDDESQFIRWNLLNENDRLVGSGLYIAHIEMPELGVSKNLKLAVIHK